MGAFFSSVIAGAEVAPLPGLVSVIELVHIGIGPCRLPAHHSAGTTSGRTTPPMSRHVQGAHGEAAFVQQGFASFSTDSATYPEDQR